MIRRSPTNAVAFVDRPVLAFVDREPRIASAVHDDRPKQAIHAVWSSERHPIPAVDLLYGVQTRWKPLAIDRAGDFDDAARLVMMSIAKLLVGKVDAIDGRERQPCTAKRTFGLEPGLYRNVHAVPQAAS